MAVRPVGRRDDYVQFKIQAHRLAEGDRTLWCKIDKDDWAAVTRHTWHATTDGTRWYAQTATQQQGIRTVISMGRLILGEGDLGNVGRVDHRNGNGMDCRRSNLRLVDQSAILAKRRPAGGASKYKGVVWDGHRGQWLATFRGRKCGRFHDERDAARAFDDAARAYWGDDCYLNFPTRPNGVPMTGARARLLTFAINQVLDCQQIRDDDDAYAALRAALRVAGPWVDEPPAWVSSTP